MLESPRLQTSLEGKLMSADFLQPAAQLPAGSPYTQQRQLRILLLCPRGPLYRHRGGIWLMSVMGGLTRWLMVVSMPLATPRPYAIDRLRS